MQPEIERRSLGDVHADGSKIVGYAIVFDALSEDLGGFREMIRPEAVDRTLREGLDVRALVNHDEGKVLGRTKAGTLTLTKDARGLRIEIDPPDTTDGRDAITLVKRGDVTGMSFAFAVLRPQGERFERRNGESVRILSDLRIKDVSLVTFPAYQQTDAQVAQRALHAIQQGGRVDWLRRRAALMAWATIRGAKQFHGN